MKVACRLRIKCCEIRNVLLRVSCCWLAGFFSHLMTMVLPTRAKRNSLEEEQILRDYRTISTQTVEQDPICARGVYIDKFIIFVRKIESWIVCD